MHSYNEELIDLIKKLPTHEVLSKNLNDLFKIDKSGFTQKEINDLYYDKAIIIPNCFAVMEFKTINLLKTFRARIINQEQEDISLINSYSYPHPVICKGNGRANIVGKPVFYCADAPITAIMELKPKAGDELFLSTWGICCDRKLHYISYISPDIKNSNPWYKHSQHVVDYYMKHVKEIDKSKVKELSMLLHFQSFIFLNELPNYHLASWLANQSLYKTNGIDFIVYPSIASDTYTCNLAFHPNFVDRYFNFDRVFRVRINNIHNDDISISFGKVGKVKQTHIEWDQLTDEDADYIPNIRPERTT